LSLVLAVAAQPLVAATYYVGSCKTGAYGTISAAVAAVPAGSTIDVCPGTYPEQVVISKALTLQGIISDNSSQAVIAMPSGGLVTTSSILYVSTPVAPQVWVTAGPVNITNITVDGTAGPTNCPTYYLIGVFYSGGSSGTMNAIQTRNQNCAPNYGVGISVENGAGATESITIENSNVNNNSNSGINAYSDQTPSTLTASIKGNYVVGELGGIGLSCNGSVSNNTVMVSGEFYGFSIGVGLNEGGVVSGNTINGAIYGVYVDGAGSVKSNKIVNSGSYGIFLLVPGATVETNIITQAPVGIEFQCNTGTVSGNTINGATTGLDKVPAGFTGVNKFYNVATTTNGCS
jgi:hypothetical protein